MSYSKSELRERCNDKQAQEPVRLAIVGPNNQFNKALQSSMHSQYIVESFSINLNSWKSCPQQLDTNVIIFDLGDNSFLPVKQLIERNPHASVVILTECETSITLMNAIKQGVRGYVDRNSKGETLIEAVEVVANGKIFIHAPFIDPLLLQTDCDFIHIHVDELNRPLGLLTVREWEILQLMVDGKSNIEIAAELNVRVNTVKNHIYNIFSKLNVRDRTQAVVVAIRNKWAVL
jgi:two-component system, NarL family, response regulator DegU